MRLIDADKLLVHLNDCALSASPGGGSLRELMLARVVNENAYLLGEAVKKIDDLSNELEELKGKLNNEH